MPPANHWHYIPVSVPHRHFGNGSQRPFSWYFERESSVKVKKYRDVLKWLAGCKYKKDAELFGRIDVWQHPIDFEALRKGDCEDHALWAWRKLVEIGLEAQLVSGKWKDPTITQTRASGHVWVMFKKQGKKSWHILEATQKNTKKMLLTPADAEKNYFPELSVDGAYQTYRFSIAKNKTY